MIPSLNCSWPTERASAGRIDSDGYEWRLESPADFTINQPDWLGELSEMRGRIIFDRGHRPSFQRADGTFADPDPVDAFAFHVTARMSGQLIGCARIVRCADACTGFTQSHLEGNKLEEVLGSLGTCAQFSGESGRWIVDPDHRGKRLGGDLMAGVYAVARWLRLRVILGWSGTHDRQDRAFLSMGWRPVVGFLTFPAPQFDDDVRLLYFDVNHMKPSQHDLSERMSELLALRDAPVQTAANGHAKEKDGK